MWRLNNIFVSYTSIKFTKITIHVEIALQNLKIYWFGEGNFENPEKIINNR